MATFGTRAASAARTAGYATISFLRHLGVDVARFPRPDSTEHLLHTIIDHLDVDLVLDVGANRGQWAQTVRALGYHGPIVSFEPVDSTFKALNRAASRDPHWTVHRIALGDSDTTADINVTVSSRTSSLRQPADHYQQRYDGAEVVRTEPVPVRRLDSICDDLPDGHRALLKCDTQGYDFEVLRGSEGALDWIVAVEAELAAHANYEGVTGWRTVVDWLAERGFVLAGLFPIGRDGQLRMTEMDAVFVRGPDRS